MHKSSHFTLRLMFAGIATLSGSSDATSPGAPETGALTVNLDKVPADAGCLEIDVEGNRAVQRRFDLIQGTRASFDLDLLPVGQVVVEARAFAAECGDVASDAAPTYAVDGPTFVEIEPGEVAAVSLSLLRNGRADFAVDFEAPACSNDANLDAVTFNIRYDSGPSGNNAWNRALNPRRERVISVLKDSQADLIGLQEVLENQVDDLVAALTDYTFFGVGRSDGERAGEFAGIFYRTERFTQIEGGNFWLSETPEVPGTVFPGSGSIRIATWVRLVDHRSNRPVLFLNTHWDNVSQSSRLQSGQLIRARLAELAQGDPVIVTGDFNTTENNAAVQALLVGAPETAPTLRDAYRLVHPIREQQELTFHNFNGALNGERIDFVLHNDDLKPLESSIVRTSFEGLYPSDHYAVSAKLRWTSDGAGTNCE